MCGIVGYIGSRQAAPLLLGGLSHLEYRGYDSAGIAVRQDDGKVQVVKAKGRLKNLDEKIDGGKAVSGHIGIGHTRWATHGEPSESNAHPHVSNSGLVTLVHNGIIENAAQLKAKLEKSGYTFYSQTDTEIAANLIDYYANKYHLGPIDSIARAMIRIRGSYALGILFKDEPDVVYAARKDSPLIIGCNEDECFLASDVPAILDQTRHVYYIDNHEIARVHAGYVEFFNIEREEVKKELCTVDWDPKSAGKDGYEHFMMKEIHEQPKAAEDVLNHYLQDGQIQFDEEVMALLDPSLVRQIVIVACGSAYHAGVAAQFVVESLARIPVRVELASEFRYRNPLLPEGTLLIAVSQSGETADTLAAIRLAKEQGTPVLGVVNVLGSSIARESDGVIYTHAGPEIAVATTKAYSNQLIVGDLIALYLADRKGLLDEESKNRSFAALRALPDQMRSILEDKERIQWFAAKYARAKDAFFIGRQIDYAAAMEGSLKMKEISYIHSEAYAAGELKHGTISLIEKGILVICVATQDDLFEKMTSNMNEVRSRGGYLFGLTSYGHYAIEDNADFTVYIPKTEPMFTPSLSILPLQLLGYYISVAKGLDVDKPRNLAKSVTVE